MKRELGVVFIGLSAGSREMIERARQRFERGPACIPDLPTPMLRRRGPDTRQPQSEPCAERGDGGVAGPRRREAELVVVAAGEQALQRDLALRAGELPGHGGP